ncbi:asparagine synthase (glutamine-hydrolyzing) [Streptomyces sp. NPDC006514]|uniref:asparagine synthase (glutamine-hydrolyzing) n=1 Tax=Streptomyces sp. NPDC006514 TaxID=3154308 RepID=UPI0033A5C4C9
MCRIHGHFNAGMTPHDLRTVGAVQRHGGPDAQSYAYGPGWALGSNRLAITDPGGGDQPYRLGDSITVVFNGEIYNHDELRRDLAARGHAFRDRCDGAVIPALYLEYGLDFTEHLDGMYAIAVMDTRAEPTLVLATDGVGMKPLYYHWDTARAQLCFASEIPALLAFGTVGAVPWEYGLDAYLATKTPFGEQTMFQGVRVLPPAATAVVSRSRGLRVFRRESAPVTDPGLTEAEAAERTRELLRREVARLTVADVPVAAITSGGLDSSLVTALAAERVADLHAFNIAYRGTWPADERAFAREVAEGCGATYHQVEIDPRTFPELLPEVVWHLGQPNADPITLSTYALFDAVRAAGYRVALTGDAADELFGGYDRIRAALRVPPGGDWVTGYVEELAAVPRAMREELYSDDYRDLIRRSGSDADHIATLLRDADAASGAGGDRLAAITAFEVGSRMPAYHLRRVDHLSMSASVEVRLPFCQPSVVDLARALPGSYKVAGDRGKRVLYAAAAGRLPASVLDRPKQPFTLPITAMLAPGQPLMAFARDLLAKDRLARRGLLDPVRVDDLLHRQAEHPSARAALAIWSLLVHELWLDQFCDSKAAAPCTGGPR